MAPISWRDPDSLEYVAKFIQMYREDMDVPLMRVFEGSEHMSTLETVERVMVGGGKQKLRSEVLRALETFHKVLVAYIWLSFRQPVAYHSHTEVAELKARVEAALHFALQKQARQNMALEPTKERERLIEYRSVRETRWGLMRGAA